MSGLSRTPGKRVWVNSPPRVRIPLAPPKPHKKTRLVRVFLCLHKANKSAAALLGFFDRIGAAVGCG